VKDRDQQDTHRTGEVEVSPDLRIAENPGRFAHIALDGYGPLVVGKQCAGVGEHDGIVVDVDGPGIRLHRTGDLVDVLLRRQARADIKELSDALASDITDRTAEEGPVQPCPSRRVRCYRQKLADRVPVAGEILLATEQEVVHTGRIGHGRVKAGQPPGGLRHRCGFRFGSGGHRRRRPAGNRIAHSIPARARSNPAPRLWPRSWTAYRCPAFTVITTCGRLRCEFGERLPR
jgi:hypothetical protein